MTYHTSSGATCGEIAWNRMQIPSWKRNGRRGTGLGLVISQGIVEAHDGRIWAESPGPGHGTTMTFTVPRTGAEPTD